MELNEAFEQLDNLRVKLSNLRQELEECKQANDYDVMADKDFMVERELCPGCIRRHLRTVYRFQVEQK
jgi:hypothetical protein